MSKYTLTIVRSEPRWFGSHNCGKEIPLLQSVLSGCHSMPRIQSLAVAPSASDYPSEIEVNCTSPCSAVAENAWRYNGTAELLTAVFNLL